jgi:hypothetical protein
LPIRTLYLLDNTHILQANPKLAVLKDDDERLPIHWAVSYGHLDIAILLAAMKNFDPDAQVRPSHALKIPAIMSHAFYFMLPLQVG